MKVTKLVHSCLLIEKDGKKVLVDPGSYSWKEQSVRDFNFSNLSAVVVTHNHPDHLDGAFAQAVAEASPNAVWYGTQEVINDLKSFGINGSTNSDDSDIQFVESQHADLSPWYDVQPEHTSYLIFSDVLISGDCQTLTSSHGASILAAAINGGPWGAAVGFAKMIEAMSDRPKVILPLHDWHWNEDARKGMYNQLPNVMDKFGVKFVALENCQEQEI